MTDTFEDDAIAAAEDRYEAWAADLWLLLGCIEEMAKDERAVKELCQVRFEIARKHGLIVYRADTCEVGHA